MPIIPQKSTLLASQIASIPKKVEGPIWKGPCSTEANGGITQSMMNDFLFCRERFRIKYILGLRPADVWKKTWGYGNMWHVCEEMLAGDSNSRSWELGLNTYCKDLCQQYPMQREEIDHWYLVCLNQFPEYVKYWQEHQDNISRTPLLQEYVFNVTYNLPSGRTVILRGKFDSVDLIKDGKGKVKSGIWLQENKTKGRVDEQSIARQLTFDLQTMAYLTGLHQGNWRSKLEGLASRVESIVGVRYNVIRNEVTIRQHKPTKSNPTGESKDHFYKRLATDYYQADPAHYFMRWDVEVTEKDIEVFCKQFLDPFLEQLCWWYDEVKGTKRAIADYPYLQKSLNFRFPFGTYNPIAEAGFSEYDAYLETGSESGLRQVTELFQELKE